MLRIGISESIGDRAHAANAGDNVRGMAVRILNQRYAIEPTSGLSEHPRNARRGDEEFIDESLLENGFFGAVLADSRTRHILVGNHRFRRAVRAGAAEVPAIWITPDDDAHARRIMLADNAASDRATNERRLLAELLKEAVETPSGLRGTGHTQATLDALLDEIAAGNGGRDGDRGDGESEGTRGPNLATRFGVPPFSILDARQGYWQSRKREWMALGIASELGRGDVLFPEKRHIQEINFYSKKRIAETLRASQASSAALRLKAEGGSPVKLQGTSIFDPVLCELAYRWFSPRSGTVLDPFAGGSVRGIVAAKLGRSYVGIELRGEQVEANRAQWATIGRHAEEPGPRWVVGDSREELPRLEAPNGPFEADLVFTCPPYADLERYSDDPKDLSTFAYPAFLEAYREIVAGAIARLRADRFAVVVVGDVRDEKGIYRNFVGDTIRAFEDAGARLYNDAIIVTMVASLSVRVGRMFAGARKLGKTHQNVLVFVKGDPKRATEACGEVEGGLFLGEEPEGEETETEPESNGEIANASEFGEVSEPGTLG